MNKYSQLSISLTQKLTKEEKKKNGIYFTPLSIIRKILENLKEYKFNQILEPACGSCEFIKHLDNSFDNCVIDGIELNQTIYNEIKKFYNSNVNIIDSAKIIAKQISRELHEKNLVKQNNKTNRL